MATIEKHEAVMISPPNFGRSKIKIYGTAPLLQNAFSRKARNQMLDAQTATKAKSRKAKDPRDLDDDYEQAFHTSEEGWHGIPCAAFRNAAISACRVAGYQMTKAKLSLFCEPQGLDALDGTPLVRIHGDPERHVSHVRLASGVASIAVRPMWRRWHVEVDFRWDADQFSHQDVCNLLERAGQQVGIGEGRPDSKKSAGLGFGTFTLVDQEN